MLPRDQNHPAGVASIQRPSALAKEPRSQGAAGNGGLNLRPLARHMQPARVLGATFLILSALATASVGVLLGGALQDRFEAGPTASQTTVLQEIGTPKRAAGAAAVDPRGPNRADLGGGRADLGGGR